VGRVVLDKVIKKEKVDAVKDLQDVIGGSSFFVFTGYEGLDAVSISKLRDEMYPDSRAQVVRNNLANIAFKNESLNIPDDVFKNTTMMFSTSEDPVKMGKSLVAFSKEHEPFALKGGVLDRKFLNREELIQLSKLPSKPELIAKSVMLIKSPINQLVANISSPLRGLVYVLQAIEKQKQEESDDK